jgi:hypothetical protein
MARMTSLLLALVVCTGCAAPAARSAPASPRSADLDAWVQAEAAPALGGSRTLSPLAAGPVRIEAPEPAPPRPPTKRQVDVSFQRADIKNAFQFLADTGQFNLVLDDTLSGEVSARLRNVDAYDALVTLADANGATVRYERKIVVVRKR